MPVRDQIYSVVTFSVRVRQCFMTGTKLYCLVTEARVYVKKIA